jgi:hypothetical protein
VGGGNDHVRILIGDIAINEPQYGFFYCCLSRHGKVALSRKLIELIVALSRSSIAAGYHLNLLSGNRDPLYHSSVAGKLIGKLSQLCQIRGPVLLCNIVRNQRIVLFAVLPIDPANKVEMSI